MYKIYNLLEKQELIPQFQNFIEDVVAKDTHKRSSNYQTIMNDIFKHEAFFIVLNEDNEIVLFEGMMVANYKSKNTARIMNRHYTNPKFRLTTIIPKKDQYLKRMISSHYTVPLQIEIARKLNLDYVFWSTEGIDRRKNLPLLISWQNELYNGFKFELLPHMYHVCRTSNDQGTDIGLNDSLTCWQNVIFCPLSLNAKCNLDYMSTDDWLFQASIHFRS